MHTYLLAMIVILSQQKLTMIDGLTWINQPRNISTTAGSNILIPCEFSGAGHALPYWRNNEHGIFYTLDLPPGYSFNSSGLIVFDINLSANMDWYSCFLDLIDGRYESTVGYITVIERRDIDISTTVLATEVYDSQKLAMSATVNPATEIGSTIFMSSELHSASIELRHNIVGVSKSVLSISTFSYDNRTESGVIQPFNMVLLTVSAIIGTFFIVAVIILPIGLTICVLKKRTPATIQAHLYEEPTLPEPVYEQVLPTYTEKAIQHAKCDAHRISKSIFQATVMMNSGQSNSVSSITMMECPAYQGLS